MVSPNPAGHRAGLGEPIGIPRLGKRFEHLPPRCRPGTTVSLEDLHADRRSRRSRRSRNGARVNGSGLAFAGHGPFAKLRRMRSPPPSSNAARAAQGAGLACGPRCSLPLIQAASDPQASPARVCARAGQWCSASTEARGHRASPARVCARAGQRVASSVKPLWRHGANQVCCLESKR